MIWELTHDATSSPPEDCVELWITSLAKILGISFRATHYLSTMLVRRANYVRLKVRGLKGGRQQSKFLDSIWTFSLPAKDVLTLTALQTENKKLDKKVTMLEMKLQESSNLLRKVADGKHGRGRSRKHGLDDQYSTRQQARIKRQRSLSCSASLQWMENEGYTPVRITAINSQNKEEVITLHHHSIEHALGEELQEEDKDMLSMMVYVKDRFSVSGAAYHEMAKVCREMPRHYKIKQKIAELNKMWDIKPTPSGILGVQQSFEPRLRYRIEQLEKKTPEDAPFKCNHRVRVKLSGDSTNMGKRIQVENFTYTLLDEGESAYSFEACHPLAIFRAPEKYDSLKLALKDLIEEMSALKSVSVGDHTYDIVYYLGGDWKFLALVTGKEI